MPYISPVHKELCQYLHQNYSILSLSNDHRILSNYEAPQVAFLLILKLILQLKYAASLNLPVT